MSEPNRPRLSAATLEQVRVDRPEYDRAVAPTIVHLGVGAFARAHLATYADDLLRTGWPATVRGVSLRSRGAEDDLAPQDGLYTVVEREPGATERPRVIGALTRVGTGSDAAVDAIAAPATQLVTLTVTEKGYEPAEVAPAVVAQGLARRRAAGASGPVVASLDNVLGNGNVLRTRVLEAADRLDPTLAGWITDEVQFPCSVVDRMVPATTEADLALVAEELGLVDRAAVVTEHHRSWVIAATDGLPPLADVGVQVVGDIVPFERRKLWLLNGPHSALAYGGLLTGCETIAEATHHPLVGPFVRQLTDEVLEVAELPTSLEPAAFAADALRRFANPSLGHTCAKVAEDGSRKLPQRLLPVVATRRRQHLPTTGQAVVVAAWLAAVAGLRVAGNVLPTIDDPAAAELRSTATRGGIRELSAAALAGQTDDGFVVEVADALDAVLKDGPIGFR